MAGRLAGIARHARPKGLVEVIGAADVTVARGIEGDYRGAMKPGGKRQVTMMATGDWADALRELGRDDLTWSDRRVNLLVDGLDLPRETGVRLRVGGVLFGIAGECDPCNRMEAVAPGLRAGRR